MLNKIIVHEEAQAMAHAPDRVGGFVHLHEPEERIEVLHLVACAPSVQTPLNRDAASYRCALSSPFAV
jgi:hypothetical protein